MHKAKALANACKNIQRQRDREAVREQRRISQRKAATGKTEKSRK